MTPPLILLVNDEKMATSLQKVMLERSGSFRIEICHTANAALQFIATQLPDLLIIDGGMPDMNGAEVIRKLRADPRTAQLRILHMSAYDPDRKLAMAAGADDYLLMPVLHTHLTAKVREMLGITESQ